MSNALMWLTTQLESRAENNASMKGTKEHFNPRPALVIYKGSTCDDILKFLVKHPSKFFNSGAIIRGTRRPHSSVSCALLYLRQHRLIETAQDTGRNERYLIYRISQGRC